MDPYRVLGVNRSASNEEIKKKYHQLVRKYHPDQHRNNPLGDLAGEKLKEINEAYDNIMKERSGGGSYTGGGSSGYTGGGSDFMRVRALIQSGNITQAEAILDQISSRPAEWHYLKGIIFLRKGWYDGARQHFQTAYSMDPQNPEYANAINQMSSQSAGYRNFYGGANTSDSCCQTCCCALALDSCCECFGGDCIPCC